jgi:hypothetical protein
METATNFVALRAEEKNAEAAEMLSDDAVFITPKGTAEGKAAVLAFWM